MKRLTNFIKLPKILPLYFFDIMILIVMGIEVLSLFFSVNPLKSRVMIVFSGVAILFFYIARWLFKNKKYTSRFFHIGLWIVLAMNVFSLYSFWILRNTLHSVEWYSFYNFRQLHRPFGLISNVWYSFLLLFLSCVLCYHYSVQKNKITCYITIVTLVLNLICSFSRSVYIILIIISLITTIQFLVTKNNRKIILCLLLPMLIGYFSLQGDCNKTLSLNSTISQQRSIEARVDSSQKSVQLLEDNVLGYGAGTYSLVNSERFEDSDIPFTSFAPNCIAQLFVEKGVIGTIVWIIFFVSLVFYSLRNLYRQPNKNLFFVGLIFFVSFFLRELSFSVFLESIYYQFLFYIGVAFLLQYIYKNEKCYWNIHINKIFAYVITLVVAVILSGVFLKEKYAIGERVNSAITAWNTYKNTRKEIYLQQANEGFKKCKELNPYDSQIQFFYWITEYEKGNRKESLQAILHLTKSYPKNAQYALQAFSFLKEEDTTKAIDYLCKAVAVSPKIIDTPFLKIYLKKNTHTYNLFKEYFISVYAIHSENPIVLAKQAKVLSFLGLVSEAKEKLTQATLLYPSLSYMWLNLYFITHQELYFKRFVLLEYGSYFVTNIEKYPRDFFVKKIDNNYLQNHYIPKYQSWYMTNPNSFLIN